MNVRAQPDVGVLLSVMKPPYGAAERIGRALISASNHLKPTRSWSPLLEDTLHRLGCRDALTPSLVARVIDPFLLPHHSLALGFFNWASQQPGFSPASVTYQSLLKCLTFSRKFNSVEKLLRQIKAQKFVLDSSVYRHVIASLIIGKKTQTAFTTFNEIHKLDIEIGPDICNSLLAALASDAYVDSAKIMFDEMRLRRIPLNTLGFGVFIGKFCRTAQLDKTLGLLDEARNSVFVINGSVIALVIVHGLCQASRTLEAFSILEELRNRECKPDFMAYRVVAESFRSAGRPDDAEKVLKKKRKFGVAPRANDYREFIFALISEKRIQEAKDMAEVIISGNFPIEDDVLNALIGSVSAVDPDSAIVFLKYMVSKEKYPSLLTLSNLSRNLCKNGKNNELSEIFRVLSSSNYFSDLESYNVMVSFLCKAGSVREAYGVLQEMRKNGLDPDVSSYNSLMEACCREDLLRPAKRLWDEMFANGCPGNLRTYNILIQKLSETGDFEEALQLFHHMLEKAIAPDTMTYTSLLEGLCREAKIETACEIFNKSIEQDILLAQRTLSPLVLNLCKGGYFLAASKVVRDVAPDIRHLDAHVILLKCLADASEIPMAIQHIKWIRDTSPSMLQAISTELVASLSSSLKPEPVLQLLDAMQAKSLSNNNGSVYLCNGSLG